LVAEKRTYRTPEDFEPYHTRAFAAIHSIPWTIGPLSGQKEPVPAAAQQLLRPNGEIFSRRYTDTRLARIGKPTSSVSFLIVQCKNANDMVGHYPPNCYPSQGHELLGAPIPRDWIVDGERIPGTEYRFQKVLGRQTVRTVVYNFMVVPKRGIVRDIKGVAASAEDYQQRYYGAAQVQVVFTEPAGTTVTESERDAVFQTLMRPTLQVLDVLKAGAV
jgi:hypothetical protein